MNSEAKKFRTEESIKRILWLSVNITTECNMGCGFCYLNNLNILKETMSQETVDCLVSRYKEHIERNGFSKHNLFTILGGEPLLHERLVKELFQKITKVVPIKFKNMFTNGVLLNKNVVDWAKQSKTALLLSANNSSLDFLEEKLSLIADEQVPSSLSITLSENNLDRLSQLVYLARDYGTNLRLRHEYSGPAREEYRKKYDEVMSSVVKEIAEKEYDFYPYLFFEMTTPWNREYFTHNCGYGYFAIDPNGDVKPCLAQERVVGNLHDKDFNFVDVVQKIDVKFDYDDILECEVCEHKIICGGGCPLTKMYAFGTHKKPSPLCKTFKKVFPYIYKMKDRWVEKNRIFRW